MESAEYIGVDVHKEAIAVADKQNPCFPERAWNSRPNCGEQPLSCGERWDGAE